MAEKLLVQLEDSDGNIYYLHTSADVVFCEDGISVQTKLAQKIEKADIIQNATTASTTKVVSASVAKNLQDQINEQNTNSLKIKPTIGSGSNLLEKTLDVGIYPYIGVTEGTPTGGWDAGTVIVLPQGAYKVRLAIDGSGTYVSTYQPGITYGTWVKQ